MRTCIKPMPHRRRSVDICTPLNVKSGLDDNLTRRENASIPARQPQQPDDEDANRASGWHQWREKLWLLFTPSESAVQRSSVNIEDDESASPSGTLLRRKSAMPSRRN